MRLRRRVSMAIGVLLAATVAVAGCGGGTKSEPAQKSTTPAPATSTQPSTAPAPAQPKAPFTITVQLPDDPPRLDPHLSSALIDRQVHNSIFDKLVEIDEKMNIVPELAEKWEVSPDGKEYTFFLRKGVKFHDGTDFNAEAVKFNIERMLTLKGSPRLSEVNLVDKVTAVDASTVKIALKKAFSPFMGILSDRAGMMLSPAAVKKSGDENFMNAPVGTGPFKYEGRVKGDSITLVKNPDYWKKDAAKADKVVFKVIKDENVALVNLKAGQVDVLTSVPSKDLPLLPNDKSVVLFKKDGLGFQGFWLNTTKPPFDNKKVRQAAAAALDAKTIAKVVFADQVTPATGPFSPNSPYHDGAQPLPRDVAKAKQLLKEAGNPTPAFTMLINPSPTNTQLAQVIQDMLQEAGFKVTIEQIEWGQILERTSPSVLNYQASPFGWSGRPEPDQNIYAFHYTKGGFNNSGFSSAAMDKLLDESRSKNGLDRKPVYAEALKMLRDEVPYIYLYHLPNAQATTPKIKNYVLYPDGMVRLEGTTKE